MCLIHGADGAISENKRLRISKKIENNKKETEMKKLINVLAVALFVVFASYNVYQSQKVEMMSDIAMENVEALAQMENDPILKEYNAVTGEKVGTGTLHRYRDDYGMCRMTFMKDVKPTIDCRMY